MGPSPALQTPGKTQFFSRIEGLIEAADCVKRFLPAKYEATRRGLRQPRNALPQADGEAPDPADFALETDHRAAPNIAALQSPQALGEQIARNPGIRVDEDQLRSMSFAASGVAGSGNLIDRLKDHPIRSALAGDFGGVIRRIIIDHDDLPASGLFLKGLSNRLERGRKFFSLVVSRNDNRDIQRVFGNLGSGFTHSLFPHVFRPPKYAPRSA